MTEFTTAEDGVRIAYESVGEGPPVMLVHGFASSRVQNWKEPGWYETLGRAGYRVIAMDCRGHGESDKPHDAERYDHARMAEDIVAVMDAAGMASGVLMGYSMGGFLSLRVLARRPEYIARLILAGVGTNYLGLAGPHPLTDPAVREAIAEGLLMADKTMITYPRARTFRDFADQHGKDRVALAACIRAMTTRLPPESFAHATQPVLVVDGEKDDVAGLAAPLAAVFSHGRAVTVPRRDHMTTVGDRVYKGAVMAFLAC